MTPLPPPSKKFDSASNGLVGVEFCDLFSSVSFKQPTLDFGRFQMTPLPPPSRKFDSEPSGLVDVEF